MVTGQISALQAVVAISTSASGVGINIAGSFTGTLTFEATVDGSTWFQAGALSLSSGVPQGAFEGSATAAGQWFMPNLGYQQVRVRATSWSQNTAYVFMETTPATLPMAWVNTEGTKATYSACVSGNGLSTGGTDLFALAGSSSKIVRLTRAIVSGTVATTAQYTSVSIIRRSSFGTGGTSTSPTILRNDSTDSTAAAQVSVFGTSPSSLGATVGILASQRYFAPLTGTPALMAPPVVFDFGIRPARAGVLRGQSDYFFINVGATPLSNASTWDVTIEWTEE